MRQPLQAEGNLNFKLTARLLRASLGARRAGSGKCVCVQRNAKVRISKTYSRSNCVRDDSVLSTDSGTSVCTTSTSAEAEVRRARSQLSAKRVSFR